MQHALVGAAATAVAVFFAGFGPDARAQEDATPFDAAVVVLDEWSRIDRLVDLDRDGDLDGVGFWTRATDRLSGIVWTYENLGGGEFAPGVNLQTVPLFRSRDPRDEILVGDWNGDGWDDIARVGNDTMTAWRTVSAASPAPVFFRSGTFAGAPILDAVALNIDGDAETDIAALHSNGITVWTNGLTVAHQWSGAGVALLKMEGNGDGVDDLGIIDAGQLHIMDLVGGSLSVQQSIAHGVTVVPMPVYGDVDGDTDGDVVVFAEGPYVVLRRTGPASFSVESPVVGGPATDLADIDGDGDLDGVCCGGGGSVNGSPNRIQATFHISINEGGIFRPAATTPNVGARHLAGAVDLDGDGDKDLVAGRSILYSRDGFAQLQGAYNSISPVLPVSNQFNVPWPVLADIDGDGDLDGLSTAGLSEPTRISVLRNNHTGELSHELLDLGPVPIPGTKWVGPGYPGDFDGDGDVDLIVGLDDAALMPQGMYLLRNAGGGHFTNPTLVTAPGERFQEPIGTGQGSFGYGGVTQLVADLDGDGDLDIAANLTQDVLFGTELSCAVWANDGQGGFQKVYNLFNHNLWEMVDMDGDGLKDLLLATPTTFGVARALAPGFWSPTVQIAGPANTPWTRVDVGELDGDPGKEVMLVEWNGADDYELVAKDYTPSGFATMAIPSMPGMASPNVSSPRYCFLEDLDGDGVDDIVAGPLGNGTLKMAMVCLATAPGVFGTPVMQVFNPQELADMDGDGDLDAVGLWMTRNVAEAAPPDAATRVQFGVSTPTPDGLLPILGSVGSLLPGGPSELRLRNGPGGGAAFLVLSLTRQDQPGLPAPGLTLYPQATAPVSVLPLSGSLGAPGEGSCNWNFTVPPQVAGRSVIAQAFVVPGTGPFGIAQTNGVEAVHGR